MTGFTLMVQGCTSDAGKSAVATALCRALRRRGVRVAPFKPQNMALNSAVTEDGGEIGRSQAVQAHACGLEPHSDMNPVLLKPTADRSAQVILQGQAIGNLDALDYHAWKPRARAAVIESHDRLRVSHDAVIAEGAGSPAEVNLREGDIANMGFAEAVDCPVILVADIDRGGVFATLIGTLELLAASERARVLGVVINRFRGDIALLQPGLDWFTERTGKPVLGVLPWLHGLYLEAEDSLTRRESDTPGKRFTVVVPVLPRISNHTDFDALALQPEIELVWVGPGETPPPADLVILPGSKSVIDDLDWLRAAGWDDYLARHRRFGGRIIGVCGGYQMLGRTLADPDGVEGTPRRRAGFGWLAIDTVLTGEKRLVRTTGRLHLDETPTTVAGYEIHMGRSRGADTARPAVTLQSGPDGAIDADGHVLGTYLHGLFDAAPARAALLRWAGLDSLTPVDHAAERERGIEWLADTVEERMDLDALVRQAAAWGHG